MAVVLVEAEKARIRYHTGYLGVSNVASIQLGFPSASQAMFLLESAMNHLLDETLPLVRERVAILDQTERQMIESQKRLRAQAVGEIKLNADEFDQLRQQYRYWAQALADIFGVPLNIYSYRFRGGARGGGLNIPVAS